jgi:hypothetical protein
VRQQSAPLNLSTAPPGQATVLVHEMPNDDIVSLPDVDTQVEQEAQEVLDLADRRVEEEHERREMEDVLALQREDDRKKLIRGRQKEDQQRKQNLEKEQRRQSEEREEKKREAEREEKRANVVVQVNELHRNAGKFMDKTLSVDSFTSSESYVNRMETEETVPPPKLDESGLLVDTLTQTTPTTPTTPTSPQLMRDGDDDWCIAGQQQKRQRSPRPQRRQKKVRKKDDKY